MDADDLRPVDVSIIDELRKGRNNAPNLSDDIDYSKQYIRERLSRLKEAGIVIPIGNGIYELVPEEIPEDG